MTERKLRVLLTAVIQSLYEIPLHGGNEDRIYRAIREFGITDSLWAEMKRTMLEAGITEQTGTWIKLTPKGVEMGRQLTAIYNGPSGSVH